MKQHAIVEQDPYGRYVEFSYVGTKSNDSWSVSFLDHHTQEPYKTNQYSCIDDATADFEQRVHPTPL